jgi:hypothetical protein
MSDNPYSVVNLKQVDDMAVKFGLSPNLESRFARGPLELEKSGLSYFRLAPGFACRSAIATSSRRRSTSSSAGACG